MNGRRARRGGREVIKQQSTRTTWSKCVCARVCVSALCLCVCARKDKFRDREVESPHSRWSCSIQSTQREQARRAASTGICEQSATRNELVHGQNISCSHSASPNCVVGVTGREQWKKTSDFLRVGGRCKRRCLCAFDVHVSEQVSGQYSVHAHTNTDKRRITDLQIEQICGTLLFFIFSPTISSFFSVQFQLRLHLVPLCVCVGPRRECDSFIGSVLIGLFVQSYSERQKEIIAIQIERLRLVNWRKYKLFIYTHISAADHWTKLSQ